MVNDELTDNIRRGGIHVGQARDITMQAGGDIVAGNKTIIQNLIQQDAQKIVTAPYKFLASYDISDRDIFFGRTAVIEDLAGKIPRHKALIINGRSGSGKTSLINAGLIPRLAENGYFYVSFRDYSHPIEQMRDYLSAHFKLERAHTRSLLEILQASSQQQGQNCVAVILDQFERFFVGVSSGLRAQFIQEFKRCMESDLSAQEMNFVFSIRQDFFGRLVDEFEAAMPTFFNDSARFNLRSLSSEEAREAIVKPLQNVPNIGYEKAFVDAVLLPSLIGQATDREQIEPPHLQIVCNQLYEEARKRYAEDLAEGEVVRIGNDLYRDLGETQGILRHYLDDFVERLANKNPERMAVVRSMLKLMIETVGTRKFVSLGNLSAGLPDVPPTDLDEITTQLQDGRVVETRGQGETASYSLSHEFMVEKVQSWYDPREMERQRAQETLERGLAEWKSTKALLNETQVTNIRQWLVEASLSADAKQLLVESKQEYEENKRKEKEQERRLKMRTRMIWSVIGLALVVAAILTYVAREEASKAVLNAEIALSRQLVAQAVNRADGELGLALLLSREAFRVHPTGEARSTLLTALQFSRHLEAFLHGHSGTVYSVAFSPDGTLMATGGGGDHQIRLWNVLRRELIGKFPAKHTDRISSLSFSSDKKTLISGSRDKTIILWDIQKQEPTKIIQTSHRFGVLTIGLSPDEKIVASTGVREYDIILWDLDSGNPIGLPLKGHEKFILNLAFHPNEDVLVSGGGDQIIVWDLKNHQPKQILEKAHRGKILSVSLSPEGSMIASGGNDNTIRLWNVKTGRPVGGPLRAHTDWVRSLAFSPNGRILVSGSRDKTLALWNVRTHRLIGQPLRGHRNSVWRVAFSPDGKTIASGGDDGQVILWNLTKGLSLGKRLGFHRGGLLKLALSSDGKTLASGGINGSIILWDVEHQQQLGPPLRGHTKRVFDVAFSPDGKMLVSGSQDGSVRLWKVNNPKIPSHTIWTGKSSIQSVAFNPSGKTIAFDTGGKLILWDLVEDKNLAVFTGQKPYSPAIAFSPTDKFIVSGGYGDGNVMLRDFISNASSAQLLGSHKKPVWSVDFSLDGKLLASGGQDQIIRIWEIEKLQQFGPILKGHRDGVESVAFSPDGTMLASGGRDMNVMLWDIQTRELIGRPFIGHAKMVRSVVFDPDGNFIVSGSFDGKIVLWDISFDSWKHQACRIANRNLSFREWRKFLGDESYRKTCPDLSVPEPDE